MKTENAVSYDSFYGKATPRPSVPIIIRGKNARNFHHTMQNALVEQSIVLGHSQVLPPAPPDSSSWLQGCQSDLSEVVYQTFFLGGHECAWVYVGASFC